MKRFFSNLLASMQKAVAATPAITLTVATCAVAMLALTGITFSFIWGYELLSDLPANIFHSGKAFYSAVVSEKLVAAHLPWEVIPNAFWALSIRMQGVIMVFIGALSLLILSYSLEWLLVVVNIANDTALTPTTTNPKWQQFYNIAKAWWSVILNTLRKIAVWLVLGIGGTTILYITWNALTKAFPM